MEKDGQLVTKVKTIPGYCGQPEEKYWSFSNTDGKLITNCWEKMLKTITDAEGSKENGDC